MSIYLRDVYFCKNLIMEKFDQISAPLVQEYGFVGAIPGTLIICGGLVLLAYVIFWIVKRAKK